MGSNKLLLCEGAFTPIRLRFDCKILEELKSFHRHLVPLVEVTAFIILLPEAEVFADYFSTLRGLGLGRMHANDVARTQFFEDRIPDLSIINSALVAVGQVAGFFEVCVGLGSGNPLIPVSHTFFKVLFVGSAKADCASVFCLLVGGSFDKLNHVNLFSVKWFCAVLGWLSIPATVEATAMGTMPKRAR